MAIVHNVEEIISDLPENVFMVAAVKYSEQEQILELGRTGIKNFGFSTYQQLNFLKELLPTDAKIHFIGHLQSNKVKPLLSIGPYLIQSVDSCSLAEKMNDSAGKLGMSQDILLQVKTDKDKEFGINLDELENTAMEIEKNLGNLRVLGLMTVPPFAKSSESLRPHFKEMKRHYDSLSKALGRELSYLSMGMSNDYRVAVQEGSNMVRIGRALFK